MKKDEIKNGVEVDATPGNMAKYYADARSTLNQAIEKGHGVMLMTFAPAAKGKDISATFVNTSREDMITFILGTFRNDPKLAAYIMALYVEQQVRQKQATGKSDVEAVAEEKGLNRG